MFSGTSQSTGYQPHTGLAAFKVVAVNPSKAEIEELIGRQYPIDVNYDQREDINQKPVRPVEFWVVNSTHNITDRVTFQIGNEPVVSQTGNYQFINAKGISRYAKTIEEANSKYEKLAPFVRPLNIGEDALYSFMQRLLGYKPSDKDANFLADAEAAGITPSNLFSGNTTGLNDFITFVNNKGRKVGLVLGVKQKEKALEDGKKVTQNRQVIINNPDFFFTLATGSVEQYNTGKMQEVIDEKVKNGVSLGTALFTVEFQKFNEANCLNKPADNPAVSSAGMTWG